jgi:hypothetical protein
MATTRTSTTTELAHPSGAGVDVTLLWVRRGGSDETLVCVSDRRDGAYFETRRRRTAPSTSTTARSPAGTSARSTARTAASRRSPHGRVQRHAAHHRSNRQ